MNNQPSYWCIANLGDADPLSHGGKFVLIDRRGIYQPSILILEPEESEPSWEDPIAYSLHTIEVDALMRPKPTSVSDNRFHPDNEAWFGDEESLEAVANFIGVRLSDFIVDMLLTSCPLKRASAYIALADYHGIDNFDSYPQKLEREKAEKLCDTMLSQIKESESWHDGYGVNK
jgi:hypothetical protein